MGYGFGYINSHAEQCHQIAKDHGFWDDVNIDDPRHILSLLMLIVTEAAEGAEAVRKPGGTKYGNLEEELADVIIRCFDLSVGLGFNIEQAIFNKMEKNRDRPHKHGKRV